MAPRETTLATSVVSDMLQYLADRGMPAGSAMAQAGIDPGFAASADNRVPGSQVERLWKVAVARTGDPLVGLHMGESYNPGSLDILGYVVLSCRTVAELLEKFARFARILNDGLRVELVRDRSAAYCACSFVAGNNYLLRAPEQAIDALWAGVARELNRLPVTPVVAQNVWFRRVAPRGDELTEYKRVIGAPLKFGATEDRFVLSAGDLAKPIRSANPALLAIFERHAEDALRSLESGNTRANQVARVLAEKLKGKAPNIQEVARDLAMSSRNLQRTLRESGTTYQVLLDEVRRDVAIRHLANPSTSVSQVGFRLGFSEPSAFHRAFRRWTGKSPGEFRAHAQ
jgi:AraC-like DNA-binding protein